MMIVPGDPNETVYYYHADSQGTIIGLTNDSGAWVEKYAYTLYGKPAAQSTVGNPYMYTGRRLDPETGLYYYRARYYDPHLRRFIETDPIGYAGGMNLYTYVGNSPVNFIDPLGLLDAKASWAYWDNVGVNGAQRAVNGGALDKITGYGQAAGAAVMCGFIDFFGARKIQENAEKAGYYSAVDGCKWEAVKLGSLVVGQIALESGVAGYVIGKAARPLIKASKSGQKFWSKAEFKGQKVFQRNDLIDPKLIDARGRTNLQRMEKGLAPIGPDGKSMNLHHTLQTSDSALAEMTQTFHQQNSKIIHINPNTIPSGIDRNAFNQLRKDYWINRASDF